VYYICGLYGSLWRYASVNEILKVIVAVTVGSIGTIAVTITLGVVFPLTVHIVSWMLTIIFIGGSRLLYRFGRVLIRTFGKEKEIGKRVMIIGAGIVEG
jgi:FlaA1/EpsC-like NDP-sugar epimerase